MGVEEILDLFYENLKPLFFPESWLQLDMKFSKSEIFTLMLMEKRQEITMTELSEYLNAPMSTANGIVERLIKKGYADRDRSETDRRIVVVRLTPAGSRLIEDLKETVSGLLKTVLSELSEEEVSTMVSIVLKVVHSLQHKLSPAENAAGQELKKISIE
jgi:DNA-binding MarR family transcriptional regulator